MIYKHITSDVWYDVIKCWGSEQRLCQAAKLSRWKTQPGWAKWLTWWNWVWSFIIIYHHSKSFNFIYHHHIFISHQFMITDHHLSSFKVIHHHLSIMISSFLINYHHDLSMSHHVSLWYLYVSSWYLWYIIISRHLTSFVIMLALFLIIYHHDICLSCHLSSWYLCWSSIYDLWSSIIICHHFFSRHLSSFIVMIQYLYLSSFIIMTSLCLVMYHHDIFIDHQVMIIYQRLSSFNVIQLHW